MRTKDLAPNPKNPRKVTDAKLEQLKKALLEFGDLSGIVFNRKTGQLVGGHQRLKSFDADAPVTIVRKFKKATRTGTVAEGYVELRGERFSYREVSWDTHREMAAKKYTGQKARLLNPAKMPAVTKLRKKPVEQERSRNVQA